MASRDLSVETLREIRDVCAMCETTNTELGQVVKKEFAEDCWLVAGNGWDWLKKSESGTADQKRSSMLSGLPDLPQTREEYLAISARIKDNRLAALEVPSFQALAKTYNLDARLEEGLPEAYREMSSFLGRGMIEIACDVNANLRGIQIQAAINLFVKDHSAAPQSLDELCPRYLKELPADPFSGESFRYQNKGGRWKFWDVGKDLKDNGGVYEQSKARSEDDNSKVFPDRLESNVELRTRG
jgi:hypothetical protein